MHPARPWHRGLALNGRGRSGVERDALLGAFGGGEHRLPAFGRRMRPRGSSSARHEVLAAGCVVLRRRWRRIRRAIGVTSGATQRWTGSARHGGVQLGAVVVDRRERATRWLSPSRMTAPSPARQGRRRPRRRLRARGHEPRGGRPRLAHVLASPITAHSSPRPGPVRGGHGRDLCAGTWCAARRACSRRPRRTDARTTPGGEPFVYLLVGVRMRGGLGQHRGSVPGTTHTMPSCSTTGWTSTRRMGRRRRVPDPARPCTAPGRVEAPAVVMPLAPLATASDSGAFAAGIGRPGPPRSWTHDRPPEHGVRSGRPPRGRAQAPWRTSTDITDVTTGDASGSTSARPAGSAAGHSDDRLRRRNNRRDPADLEPHITMH